MDKNEASKRIGEYLKSSVAVENLTSSMPDNANPYLNFPIQNYKCWYYRTSYQEIPYMLCESRMIIMNDEDGAILYDGGANDEG